MEEQGQGAVVGVVPTNFVETNRNDVLSDVEAEAVEAEAKIRSRALGLMKESMGSWDDESIAALTDGEITELTGIFIERAEIEVTGNASASGA